MASLEHPTASADANQLPYGIGAGRCFPRSGLGCEFTRRDKWRLRKVSSFSQGCCPLEKIVIAKTGDAVRKAQALRPIIRRG